MSSTPESKVKAKVRDWLKARGIWFFMPSQNGRGVVGIPDFICCVGGHFLAIETKAPGRKGDTTPPQELQIAGIRKAMGTAVVIDNPDDLVLLEHKLRSFIRDHSHG